MRTKDAKRHWLASLIGLVSLALASVAAAESKGLEKTKARLAAGEPTTIVCLGDSVTGVYYHTGGRRAYTDMLGIALRAAYPQAKLTMVNAGISGHTTKLGLDRLQRDVLDKRPHLVTIMFGLNDMVRGSAAEYQANLREIIRRVRDANAETLLCTPNGVIDSSGRPNAKLAEFCDALRAVGRELDVPVADCYAAYGEFQQRDPLAWRLLLSDAIHPNMDGHKFLAVEIARTISGQKADLSTVGPPAEPLAHVRQQLAAGKPLRVVAMTPFDEPVRAALAAVAPTAKLEIIPWPAAGQSLAQIVEFGGKVRGLKPDLVVVAIPADATANAGAPQQESAIQGYSATLNAALSFGLQEWDVIGLSPRLAAAAPRSAAEQTQDDFARRLIAAQDLTLVDRPANSQATAEQLLVEWFRERLK